VLKQTRTIKVNSEPNIDAADWNAFLKGEASSLSALYERHYKKLFRYGIKIINDEAWVEDCIQDMFLELWKNRKHLSKVEKVNFYLLKSLRRKILKKVNHHTDRLSEDDENYPFLITYSIEDSLVAHDVAQELGEKLTYALSLLTPRQKEAIYLKFYNDLSYEEIGGVMNISYQSLRTLVYQAIKLMKQQIILGEIFFLLLIHC
jgi:RNA polymerase sigma factor (sigma-70 family)